MEFVFAETSFFFPEEALILSDYLQGLQEMFGSKITEPRLALQEVEVLHKVLVKEEDIQLSWIQLLDALCFQFSKAKNTKSLQEAYDWFIYIVGEHTSLVPKLSEAKLEDAEITELKELFSEEYAHIAFMLQHKGCFQFLETEEVYPESKKCLSRIRARQLRFKTYICNGFDVIAEGW